jgi:hypothetical protein
LSLADSRSQPVRDLVPPLNHIFGDVVDHLCTAMRGHLCPARGATRRFHRVADVFAVADRSFAEQFTRPSENRNGITGVGARLLSTYILFDCAVNRRARCANLI